MKLTSFIMIFGQIFTKKYPLKKVSRQTDVHSYNVCKFSTLTRTPPSGKMATFSYNSNTNYLAEITWSGPRLYGAGENQTYTYWLLVSTSWKLREKLLGAVEYTQPDLA